jgi:electron transport complex protein RnfC
MQLNPTRLAQLIRAERVDELDGHYLKNCFECAACSFVCPSRIPLVQWMRMGKAMLRAHEAAPAS